MRARVQSEKRLSSIDSFLINVTENHHFICMDIQMLNTLNQSQYLKKMKIWTDKVRLTII